MTYRKAVWGRAFRRWRHEARTHLLLHAVVAVGGAVAGFALEHVLNVPTLSVGEWASPAFAAVVTLVAYSFGRFAFLRHREPGIIYDELQARIESLESNYRATHPRLNVTLEDLADTVSLKIENTGAAAALRAKLFIHQGAVQPPIGAGPFLCRWPDGNDQMLIPKDAAHSLRIATLARPIAAGVQWTLHYLDHGSPKTARLFFLPTATSSAAVLEVEFIPHPENPTGLLRKRIQILGDRYAELRLAPRDATPTPSPESIAR